jgi:Mg2+ and Co2+ transporter CorA
MGKEMPEKRKERMQDLAVWKMLEVLDLSDEQTDKFLPALRQMQKQEERLQMERQRVLDELERALSGGEEREVSDLIGQIKELERQAASIREDFFRQAGSILTVPQLGKLILFQDRFEKRLREMMMEQQMERWRQMQEKKGR